MADPSHIRGQERPDQDNNRVSTVIAKKGLEFGFQETIRHLGQIVAPQETEKDPKALGRPVYACERVDKAGCSGGPLSRP